MNTALFFSLAIQVENSEVSMTFKAEPQTELSCPVCVGNTHTRFYSRVVTAATCLVFPSVSEEEH